MRPNIIHRISRQSLLKPNPLDVLIVVMALEGKAVSVEWILGNFCQRPGRMMMDH